MGRKSGRVSKAAVVAEGTKDSSRSPVKSESSDSVRLSSSTSISSPGRSSGSVEDLDKLWELSEKEKGDWLLFEDKKRFKSYKDAVVKGGHTAAAAIAAVKASASADIKDYHVVEHPDEDIESTYEIVDNAEFCVEPRICTK